MSKEREDATDATKDDAPAAETLGGADADVTLTKSARPTGKRGGSRTRAALEADGDTLTEVADDDDTGAGSRPKDKRPKTKSSTKRRDGSKAKAKNKKPKRDRTGPSRNPIVRIWQFLREVVGELRKVIWPSRKQLINYTIVVLVFVVIISAIIGGLDLGFARLVLWAFG